MISEQPNPNTMKTHHKQASHHETMLREANCNKPESLNTLVWGDEVAKEGGLCTSTSSTCRCCTTDTTPNRLGPIREDEQYHGDDHVNDEEEDEEDSFYIGTVKDDQKHRDNNDDCHHASISDDTNMNMRPMINRTNLGGVNPLVVGGKQEVTQHFSVCYNYKNISSQPRSHCSNQYPCNIPRNKCSKKMHPDQMSIHGRKGANNALLGQLHDEQHPYISNPSHVQYDKYHEAQERQTIEQRGCGGGISCCSIHHRGYQATILTQFLLDIIMMMILRNQIQQEPTISRTVSWTDIHHSIGQHCINDSPTQVIAETTINTINSTSSSFKQQYRHNNNNSIIDMHHDNNKNARGANISTVYQRETTESCTRVCQQHVRQQLNQGTGVLDVAGGMGLISQGLASMGIQSTVIDPRCCDNMTKTTTTITSTGNMLLPIQTKSNHNPMGFHPCNDQYHYTTPKFMGKKVKQYQNNGRQSPASMLMPMPSHSDAHTDVTDRYNTLQAYFSSGHMIDHLRYSQLTTDDPLNNTLPICGIDHHLVQNCSAIVALYPDEATDAIVDAAITLQRPFAVVPCCVMAKQFPHRRKPSHQHCPLDGHDDNDDALVCTYSDLLEYLMAKHESIRKTDLPWGGGKNIVLWSIF